MRHSIEMQLTTQEWKILDSALAEVVSAREEQSRFVGEDCSCGAVELKHEADVLRQLKNTATRQMFKSQ